MSREQQLAAVLARRWQKGENDAARLAQFVHDGISQQATAIHIGLSALASRLRREPANDFSAELGELRDLSLELTQNATRLVDQLHPPVLDAQSLDVAVRWKAGQAQRELAIPVRCESDEVSLPAERSLLLFRILEEGLANVARHAAASSVVIRLKRSGDYVTLTVEDDGRGFDPAVAVQTSGLVDLQMRTERLQGELTVTSRPGEGTCLSAKVPLGQEEPATAKSGQIHVLLADDHPVVRHGLRQILTQAAMRVDEVGSIPALRDYLTRRLPDVLLLDINMPGGNGLEMLPEIRKNYPHVPVLVLSVHREDQAGVSAILSGARGYLTKDTEPDKLVDAVRKLHQGGRYLSAALSDALADHLQRKEQDRAPHLSLSPRERTVLMLIAEGKSSAVIGAELNVSPKTIATYRARIAEKMGLKSTADLTRYVIEHGLD